MKEIEMHPFGENLKEARKNAGLSQKDLAEKAGVSVQIISEWERGKKGISAEYLARLSEALLVSMDALWKGHELQVQGSYPTRKQTVLSIVTLLQRQILIRDDCSYGGEYCLSQGYDDLIRDIESAIRNSGGNLSALKEQLGRISENTPFLGRDDEHS